MAMFLRWVLYSLAIMLIAWLLPGISISSFWAALLVIVIMGLLNMILRPILLFITLPINFLTLGLFSFVLNALLFMLAGYIAPGFSVDGFWSALLGSLLLALLSIPINRIGNDD
ncbi:phage holin family protein [bacterium]|nr:phage holin family protein [bacterium]